jgi:predicted amidohydrolase YtcJ
MTDARLWHHGQIFTGRRYVEALLVENGRVTTAGSVEETRRDAPTGTEMMDLAGRLLLPGLIDAHLHIADLTRAREGLDLSGARSVTELLEGVRAWAEAHPTGPVVGRGWDAERWVERRWPIGVDLDRAIADRPLVLYHSSGHAAVVNSAALEVAGVGRVTPDPPSGRFGRDSEGVPDGRLYEGAMQGVAGIALLASPPEEKAIERTLRAAASLGLTTVTSMNVGPEEAAVLRGLAEKGKLPIRVRVYLRLSRFEEVGPTDLTPVGPDGMHRVTGVKAFTDGAFGPRTAWLSAPYADAPEEAGVPVGTDAELAAGLDRAVSVGLAPALHAIGDRAVDRALRLLRPFRGSAAAPARIEHAGLTPPEVFPLLDEVRPVLAVQPGFVWSDAWLRDRLGRDRARWAYAFRSLADRGHVLAGSSDAPYDPVDPWRGLEATIHRRDPEGRSANPDTGEALPPEEAIRMYTENGGRALGEPDLGHLEPGARADLLVLATPTLVQAISIGSAAVREVWVGGRVLRTGARTAEA